VAIAGLFTFLLVACGGDDPESPEDSVPPSTIVSVSTPQLDSPAIDLDTTQSTTYYSVSGSTTEEIFASIEENGPTDDVGQQGSGLTSVEWEYKWTGDQAASGECSIRGLSIRATIVVELPQHEDEAGLSETVRANWLAYVQGVAEHEQRHVDIYFQGAREIKAAMEEVGVEPTCDALEALIDDIWNEEQARINGLQETFHSEENARLAASRDPLEQQIEANRAQLQSLQGQISALDQQINHLRAEIAVFDNEVMSIDAQVKQINEQFPDELPPAIRDRLEQLIQQSNDLLLKYNQRVEEHNGAIHARNALSEQYDALLFETNQLVDQYNWTR
jgi:predicted secreted Zn-dependent protease